MPPPHPLQVCRELGGGGGPSGVAAAVVKGVLDLSLQILRDAEQLAQQVAKSFVVRANLDAAVCLEAWGTCVTTDRT